MSNFQVGDKLVAIDNYVTEFGDKIIKGLIYTFDGYDTSYKWEKCNCCGHSGGYPVMVKETGDAMWAPCCTFRKIDPAKQKTSYRLANLEILTQFPVIKERSDQPLIKEQEVEHA